MITLTWGMDALLQRIKALLDDQDQIKSVLHKIRDTQDEHLVSLHRTCCTLDSSGCISSDMLLES